jgi:hypothetical protein
VEGIDSGLMQVMYRHMLEVTDEDDMKNCQSVELVFGSRFAFRTGPPDT